MIITTARHLFCFTLRRGLFKSAARLIWRLTAARLLCRFAPKRALRKAIADAAALGKAR